jgi:predicted amidohydrolase YtcJ
MIERDNMLVIFNASVHTFDPEHPYVTAIAIDADRILAVGSDDEIRSAFPTKNLLNANQQIIIPGLTDSHIHLEDYALSLQKVDCETPTQQECLKRVAQRTSATPPDQWVLGHGWNHNSWPEGYGSALQLDEIAPQNPVYLTHKSLHCSWANQAALHLAGIDRNTTDPPEGRIGRLPDGEPDGILFESAMQLVEDAIPESSLEQVVATLRATLPNLWRLGLTGAHDFNQSRCFSALQILHQNDELKLRVVKSIPLDDLEHAIHLGLRTGYGDAMLRTGCVKLFSDGALGPHTAAMFDPYEDDQGNNGMLMMEIEQLVEIGQQASSAGISLAVHAIGDLANHVVLNAYAQIRDFELSHPSPANQRLRHRIEHVQVIYPDDVKRFSQLGIIASMQPIHATSDMLMADKYWGQRSQYAYAWREQLKHGNVIIFGSDAPVESPNPWWGIYAAVTRQRAEGYPSHGWYPEQRLSPAEALQAYTTAPAYASGQQNCLGMLATNYLADLVVLDTDPFTCPPQELINIKPLATMVGGEWVFKTLI